MNPRALAFATAFLLTFAPLPADHPGDPTQPGHSFQGESFSEGPRQKAVLLEGVAGICHFPVTTTSAEAQQFFDQGVTQLHGFWFLEAERSFRQVLLLDPECTTAYWGMAMANVENGERAKEIMEEAMEAKREHLTPREQAWLQSLSDFHEKKKGGDDEKARLRNLVRDWEQIVVDNPEDIEAKAFLVGRIWRSHAYQGVSISSHLSVDAMAKEVLAKAPHHPGIHHYRVHLWNGEKDERALDSAALLGPAAPGIAHNWHMSGHTYSALRRYADAAWQQEASARVDHAHMIRYRVMPDEIHNYAHNNGWLVEDYGYTGRVRDAVAMATNMIQLPRIPRGKTGENTANQDWSKDGSSWAEGRRRLLWTLLTFEQWQEALRLEPTPYLAPAGDENETLAIDHLLTLARFETGDQLGGLRGLLALHERERKLQDERDAAVADAEKKAREAKKSADEVAKSADAARKNFSGRLDRVRERIDELSLVQKLAAGEMEPARAKLTAGVPGVPNDRLVRYWAKVGDTAKALELAKKVADDSPGQVAPLAAHAAALAAAGKSDEAQARFAELRPLAAAADLDLPVFRRLGAMAAGDWRQPAPLAADLGKRPPLDALGPAHWQPPVAPEWEMAGLDGAVHRSGDFAGKPHLLVFFLGKACTHCMEQLNAFAPKAKDWEAAGLPIHAVSTDSVDGLRKTLATDGATFPFPLLSDEKLGVFKAFRAYDDFESKPLHATVLIDGAGRIRWQHVSFTPFMKIDFLLEEAKRLLSLPPAPAAVAGAH